MCKHPNKDFLQALVASEKMCKTCKCHQSINKSFSTIPQEVGQWEYCLHWYAFKVLSSCPSSDAKDVMAMMKMMRTIMKEMIMMMMMIMMMGILLTLWHACRMPSVSNEAWLSLLQHRWWWLWWHYERIAQEGPFLEKLNLYAHSI